MKEAATPARPRLLGLSLSWWVLLLVAVGLRIASVAGLASDLRVAEPLLDGDYYLDLAKRLAAGRGWPAGPLFMTPLYPWLLGLLFRLTGATPLAVQVIQAVLGLGTLALLAATARRELGERNALALAGLYVLCGPLLGSESQVLTEPLLLFLTAAALYVWPKPGQSRGRHLLFGVIAGLLVIGRGVFLLLPVAAAIHYRLVGRAGAPAPDSVPRTRRRRGGAKDGASPSPRRAPGLAAGLGYVALGLALALLPLALKQSSSTGPRHVLTLNGGLNLFIGNHASADGMYRLPPDIDLETDITAPRAAARLAGRTLSPEEASRFWPRRALADLAATPGRWLALWSKKALLFLSPRELPQSENFQILREHHLPLRLAVVDFAWLLPLAVLGVAAHLRRRKPSEAAEAQPVPTPALAPWLIVIGVGWLSTIVFFATGRNRLPFLAGFLGPAALGLLVVVDALRARRWRHVLIALPLTIAVQWLLPSYPVAQARAYDHRQLALRMRHRNDPAGAMDEYRKATQVDPNDGLAWHGMGVVYAHMQRLPAAAAAYREALQRIPDSALTHYNVGVVLGRMSQDQDALPELKEAVRLDPYDLRFRADLAVATARLGNKDEAEKMARELLNEKPGFPAALRLLRQIGREP